ncbi:unnamed protein product (macronuclear) [Paramecium tetraurelia]|uniref:Uncharacterized protein n=1 Tax=Paramecium tetraurelia TaxID=5888 RepID=A0C897_PARTE|nr:uncharacterized protein GSPATT00036145001 [Paramecium tetraurelia]CAK67014.1 unnamed protein product [Paramecium tetraurelia]|eukprot:XP_001434411.1 hypothetical protein (macronuclear) [Paramecium tetraurelia strain d4-2]
MRSAGFDQTLKRSVWLIEIHLDLNLYPTLIQIYLILFQQHVSGSLLDSIQKIRIGKSNTCRHSTLKSSLCQLQNMVICHYCICVGCMYEYSTYVNRQWVSNSVNFIRSIIHDITHNQAESNRRMRDINKYMDQRKIPQSLQRVLLSDDFQKYCQLKEAITLSYHPFDIQSEQINQ